MQKSFVGEPSVGSQRNPILRKIKKIARTSLEAESPGASRKEHSQAITFTSAS